MEFALLNLPLEIICNILLYLTPDETSKFARTSRTSSRIFKFDFDRIINRVISEWFVLIFKCPRCNAAIRGGSEVTSVILVGSEEKLYRTCRKCYHQLRKESMKTLNDLLIKYRSDRDQPSIKRRLAYLGMRRYQSSCNMPGKKDLYFMQNIVKKICAT